MDDWGREMMQGAVQEDGAALLVVALAVCFAVGTALLGAVRLPTAADERAFWESRRTMRLLLWCVGPTNFIIIGPNCPWLALPLPVGCTTTSVGTGDYVSGSAWWREEGVGGP